MKKIFIEIGGHIYPSLECLCKKLPEAEKREMFGKRAPYGFFDPELEWEGYVIEPMPDFFSKSLEAQKKYAPHAKLTNILGAVAPARGFRQLITYFSGKNPETPSKMSSLVAGSKSEFTEHHEIQDEFFVPTFTLDELLTWIGINPTILRVDIELIEREVFETFSWGWRPSFIQVDHHDQHVDFFVKLFESKGYQVEGTSLGEDGMEIWATYI